LQRAGSTVAVNNQTSAYRFNIRALEDVILGHSNFAVSLGILGKIVEV
jgi:hypothetical protein